MGLKCNKYIYLPRLVVAGNLEGKSEPGILFEIVAVLELGTGELARRRLGRAHSFLNFFSNFHPLQF